MAGFEDAAGEIIGLYRRHAAAWDARRGDKLVEQAWLDRFLDLVPAGGELLDLGCGSGRPVARYCIERGYRITGVDSSPELIDLCRERFPGQSWLEADMRTLDLGRRFGGLLAWHSLFHLTHANQRTMFDVFQAHAQPGAPLLFDCGWNHGYAMGEFEGERLFHASLDPDEYRALLTGHGFEVIAHEPAMDVGAGVLWLARAL